MQQEILQLGKDNMSYLENYQNRHKLDFSQRDGTSSAILLGLSRLKVMVRLRCGQTFISWHRG